MSNDAIKERFYSVSEINQLAAGTLERQFGSVTVEGEISDLLQHRSGHWYLTLKDEQALLRAAMFRHQNNKVRFSPKNGDKIRATGRLTIYPVKGSYQLVIQAIEPAGDGDLQKRFLELKKELEALGWFEQEHKQTLPDHIQQIAVITSAQGAALQDILSTLARRDPQVSVIVVPVRVQGESASTEIANAISRVNQLVADKHALLANTDSILIARGGGSLEDLWAFNEKNLARAIFESQVPVVSAVGHETDFTIADLVADLRAATPTAAAELLSTDQAATIAQLESLMLRLSRAFTLTHWQLNSRLEQLGKRLRSPAQKLDQQSQAIDFIENRLNSGIQKTLEKKANQLRQQRLKLASASPRIRTEGLLRTVSDRQQQLLATMQNVLRDRHQRLSQLSSGLHLVSPLATLSRGYTITATDKGTTATSTASITKGDTIHTRFADGTATSIIESIEPLEQ